MRVLSIIPARMGSSRFPGKPLAKINGKHMIDIIYNVSKKSKLIFKTYIATCDNEIFDHCIKNNQNVVMTSKKHQRATDRTEEALKILEKKLKKTFDIILMIQGDEPMVTTQMLNLAIKKLRQNKNYGALNLYSKILTKKETLDKNTIKVVISKNQDAIYFSRSIIPSNGKFNKDYFKQVCVIPFRRKFLKNFIKMKETILEKKESIDMNRALENNIKIKMQKINKFTHAVDHLYDIKIVEKYLKR